MGWSRPKKLSKNGPIRIEYCSDVENGGVLKIERKKEFGARWDVSFNEDIEIGFRWLLKMAELWTGRGKIKENRGPVAYDVIGLKVREPMREKMRSRMPHTQSLIKLIHIVSMYKRESVRILVTVSSLFRIFKMEESHCQWSVLQKFQSQFWANRMNQFLPKNVHPYEGPWAN